MTQEQLLQIIDDAKEEHLLKKSTTQNKDYHKSFIDNILPLINNLTQSKVSDLLTNKLQLSSSRYNEHEYLQLACESTIVSYFANLFNENFIYEPKLNQGSDKNVECSFTHKGVKYNIEVKTPDYREQRIEGNPQFFSLGRLPEEHRKLAEHVMEGVRNVANDANIPQYQNFKRLDNKLKDYLLSAQEKFSNNSTHNDVNILFVNCNTDRDVHLWINYLYGNEGFFSNKKSNILPIEEYDKTDIVVLTNIYYRHKNEQSTNYICDSFSLKKSFNLAFDNPYRQNGQEFKNDGIALFFEEVIPNNYSEDFISYIQEQRPAFLPYEAWEQIGFIYYLNLLKAADHLYF
ncbi:hypothetical protein [Siphonobacter sp. SORGH_AS_0500]|uniref:hypothetical protein n=1 Tax=Siphonobacter sp. SORGH_AS_0500 TaxID=1864824 RepID=UPI0028552C31|nr:hypothetical protein [Siphonobacter sp. SORGH_AS_0500]MDR6193097.1 hypothetical protein [Siphonobacter sp. SORGH_AS_0500]